MSCFKLFVNTEQSFFYYPFCKLLIIFVAVN